MAIEHFDGRLNVVEFIFCKNSLVQRLKFNKAAIFFIHINYPNNWAKVIEDIEEAFVGIIFRDRPNK